MDEFLTYSPERVIDLNLRESAQRFLRVCRQEHLHLRDLAEEVAKTPLDPQELLASLPDRTPDPFLEESEGDGKAVKGIQALHAAALKVLFATELCRALEKRIPLSPALFFGEPSELSESAAGLVLYQKSSFADEAYLGFAKHVEGLHAQYASSFSRACEDVYNGLCEYCILPVFNTSEGPLGSFYRLIDRYDLKIVATCTARAAEGSPETTFALLRRELLPNEPLLAKHERRYLAFTLTEGSDPVAARLLAAAELCGLSPEAVDTTLPSEAGESISLRYTLSVANGDLRSFLLYLAMDAPHYRPLGLYAHLGHEI